MTLLGSCLLRRMLPKLMLPMFDPGSISGTTCASFTGLSAHLPWSYRSSDDRSITVKLFSRAGQVPSVPAANLDERADRAGVPSAKGNT
jgi:hypothetical protein